MQYIKTTISQHSEGFLDHEAIIFLSDIKMITPLIDENNNIIGSIIHNQNAFGDYDYHVNIPFNEIFQHIKEI